MELYIAARFLAAACVFIACAFNLVAPVLAWKAAGYEARELDKLGLRGAVLRDVSLIVCVAALMVLQLSDWIG